MEVTIIDVPDKNDSVSRIVIDGKAYQLRFTWNDRGGYWVFVILDSIGTPILMGVKVVPSFPLNLFCGNIDLPDGVFGVYTELETIGREDFANGKAQFAYIPNDE